MKCREKPLDRDENGEPHEGLTTWNQVFSGILEISKISKNAAFLILGQMGRRVRGPDLQGERILGNIRPGPPYPVLVYMPQGELQLEMESQHW